MFFVKSHDNLENLPRALEEFEVVVTFNGKNFDLKMYALEFPDRPFPVPTHVDLAVLLDKLGVKPRKRGYGLKALEHDARSHPRALATMFGIPASKTDISASKIDIPASEIDIPAPRLTSQTKAQASAREYTLTKGQSHTNVPQVS